ncbi:unnamed protein product [Paramecium octaurelia]|uniref:Uncharacterized protein n=1 Tax=Paramecium octaurelia TaxID=43137 RepID=A0A8S1X6G6_PAROT|nr:unnamed protein product [Paramecium octaurelia]
MGNKPDTTKQAENTENNNQNKEQKKSNDKKQAQRKNEKMMIARMLVGQNGCGFEEIAQESENYEKFTNIIANATRTKD